MAKQIEVTRTFNAPAEMVWKLWTDPELVKRWWGPKNFICHFAEIDFRVGGKSLVSMQAPKEMGGQEYYSIWEYISIDPLYRITFIQRLADKNGNKIVPTAAGMPADFPADIKTVVVLRQLEANITEMTVTEFAEFGSISSFAQIGLEQSVEKMAAIFV